MKNIKWKTVETIIPSYPDGVIMIKEDTEVEFPIAIVPFPMNYHKEGVKRQRERAKLMAAAPELLEKLKNYQKSPWQPVSLDNLPPLKSNFIVISNTGCMKFGFMQDEEYRKKRCEIISKLSGGRTTTIWDEYGLPQIHRADGNRWTHWMLIPKLEEE